MGHRKVVPVRSMWNAGFGMLIGGSIGECNVFEGSSPMTRFCYNQLGSNAEFPKNKTYQSRASAISLHSLQSAAPGFGRVCGSWTQAACPPALLETANMASIAVAHSSLWPSRSSHLSARVGRLLSEK